MVWVPMWHRWRQALRPHRAAREPAERGGRDENSAATAYPKRIDLHLSRGTMDYMPKPLPVIQPVPNAAACCAPLMEAPLSAEQAEELSVRLKAIADPTRLRLLSLMLASPGLEACTCDLTESLGLTQPTVTHHLRTLAKAGLVVPERRVGNFTYYQVVTDALAGLAGVLSPVASV